jgi:hypothetical protein
LTLVAEVPAGRWEERAYVIDLVLRRWLGIEVDVAEADRTDVVLRLAGDASARRITVPDLLLGLPEEAWLAPASLPAEPIASLAVPGWLRAATRLERGEIPVPYAVTSVGGPAVVVDRSADGSELRVRGDLLGSVFFLVTRYEELIVRDRDEHGRFPARASLAARAGFLDRPLADELTEVLRGCLTVLWPELAAPPSRGQVALTHDIDLAFYAQSVGWRHLARSTAADVLKRRDPALAWRRLASYVTGRAGRFPSRDPFATFDELMEISEQVGLRSAFYFMARRTDPLMDATYDLGHAWLQAVMKRVAARSHEVGLHGSYASYLSGDLLGAEFERLRGEAERAGVRQDRWGGRQHFLRWDNPTTWRAWADAGLAYDSTLAFAEELGFRCGTGRPFPVFDLLERRQLELVERPLGVMDATLFAYGGITPAAALPRIVEIARRSLALGGDFVLLWHNNNLVSAEQRRVYVAAVDAVTSLG